MRFEIETRIRAPAERCFDLARDVDVHMGSVRSSGERAVAGVMSGLIGAGDDVTWQARHFGVPWRLTARITALDPPRRFVDEMQRGPFASFHHEHLFEQEGATTTMRNIVSYTMPLGPLGTIADRVFVGRHLRRLIAERGRYIARVAAGESSG